MTTLLPPSTDITASSTKQGGAKVYHAAVRSFIATLLGTDAEDKPAARAALGAQAASDVLSGIAAGTSQTSYKNILINSNFQINNGNAGTPYVSGAGLPAGQTGHECWKAGASGGDYTFTQNAAINGITIASGKSLIQVIEDKFVRGGTYILHWTGTAKCRAGINSATPSGSYVTSPLVITGQSKGVTMSIEVLNDGAGGGFEEPQLERSSIITQYEFGADELRRTQRYYRIGNAWYRETYPKTAATVHFAADFPDMRSSPNASILSVFINDLDRLGSFGVYLTNSQQVVLNATVVGGTGDPVFCGVRFAAEARL